MRRISMATRDELVRAVSERYGRASREERGRILDEFAAVTGLHRKQALVHSVDGGRDNPSPGPLCDDPLATDGFRASCQQHPVQDGHADSSLGLLGSEAAGSQPWSNQRFVAAHCCFY